VRRSRKTSTLALSATSFLTCCATKVAKFWTQLWLCRTIASSAKRAWCTLSKTSQEGSRTNTWEKL
jgi:hypothetical protein